MKISTTTSFIHNDTVMDNSFAVLSEVGFEAVDFDIFSLSSSADAFHKHDRAGFKAFLKNIAECANKNGLEISQINAPLLLMADNGDTEFLRQCAVKSVYAAGWLDAPYIVFRAGIRESLLYAEDVFRTSALRICMIGKSIVEYMTKYQNSKIQL